MIDSILAWVIERGVDNELLVVIGAFVAFVGALMGYLIKKGYLTKDSRWFRWTARLSAILLKAVPRRRKNPTTSTPPKFSSRTEKPGNGLSPDHDEEPEDYNIL